MAQLRNSTPLPFEKNDYAINFRALLIENCLVLKLLRQSGSALHVIRLITTLFVLLFYVNKRDTDDETYIVEKKSFLAIYAITHSFENNLKHALLRWIIYR